MSYLSSGYGQESSAISPSSKKESATNAMRHLNSVLSSRALEIERANLAKKGGTTAATAAAVKPQEKDWSTLDGLSSLKRKKKTTATVYKKPKKEKKEKKEKKGKRAKTSEKPTVSTLHSVSAHVKENSEQNGRNFEKDTELEMEVEVETVADTFADTVAETIEVPPRTEPRAELEIPAAQKSSRIVQKSHDAPKLKSKPKPGNDPTPSVTSSTPSSSMLPPMSCDSSSSDSDSESAPKKTVLYTGSSKGGGANYVRANMKSTGSSKFNRSKGRNKNRHSDRRKIYKNTVAGTNTYYSEREPETEKKYYARSAGDAGVDVVDDLIDGKFNGENTKSKQKSTKIKRKGKSDKVCCPRHNRPCKTLVVKKPGPNRGKKFLVCSLPRGEGCDFFKWMEDSTEGIIKELKEGSSKGKFVERKVKGWMERFKKLTIKELRDQYGEKIEGLLNGRSLKSLKKTEIIARLVVWVRGEVGRGVDEAGGKFVEEETSAEKREEDGKSDSDSDDSLEIEGGSNDLWEKHLIKPVEEPMSDEDEDEFEELDYDNLDLSAPDPSSSSSSSSTSPSPRDPATLLKSHFHHDSFRPGQAWAINRVLGRQRSLLVAATGGGKSLCYALPSALLPGVTIVVSPLISLMEDQLSRLPPRISAASLSGPQSKAETAIIISDLCQGRVKVLFCSPERLCSSAFKRLLRKTWNAETRKMERQLPEVSLLCVDEAHCLSQWSHNFRASYMRLRGVLELIEPESVLALTATAGTEVINDVCRTLGIPEGRTPNFEDVSLKEKDNKFMGDQSMGVRVLSAERDNIDPAVLVVDSEEARRAVLFKMLRPKSKARAGSKLEEELNKVDFAPGCLSEGSVIVYVWTKRQAEALCDLLRGAEVQGNIVYYHGGMSASERFSAQSRFMRGKARVIVATVAFGLGIDKGDVAGVVHCCLPKSFEHYIQEIGRAGRDGSPVLARALVLREDVVVQHSLSHSNGISRSQIERFLSVVENAVTDVIQDIPEDVREGIQFSELDVSVPLLQSINKCDLREETVETLLSLMEESEFGSLLHLEGGLPDRCVVILKRRTIDKIEEPVTKCISRVGSEVGGASANAKLQEEGGTAMEKGFHAYALGNYAFSVTRVANAMGSGCQPRHVFAALRRLEGQGELEVLVDLGVRGKGFGCKLNKAGVEAFWRNGRDEQARSTVVETVCNKLAGRMEEQETAATSKVEEIWSILYRMFDMNKKSEWRRSDRIKVFGHIVRSYFEATSSPSSPSPLSSSLSSISVPPVLQSSFSDSDLRRLSREISSLRSDSRLSPSSYVPGSISISHANDYGARCITNLLHGIDLPRQPMSMWWGTSEFGCRKDWDYKVIHKTVEEAFGV
ncbi:hypothetical protein TrST_g12566 [Triparma strigata]|uniref:DNA 3'-5' helicase n=1 Tax=Triparma strigata TaxID=1606541 RepID=A0A9W7B9P4_9STRA|nr:hypothetical protein TrST_g12566 [Triparma strigata]